MGRSLPVIIMRGTTEHSSSKTCKFCSPDYILIKWIASFLTETTQYIKVCNTHSEWNYIHGGVPQSIQLGPVPFVLMIIDLQRYENQQNLDKRACY